MNLKKTKRIKYKTPLPEPYPNYSMMEMLKREDKEYMKKHKIQPVDYAPHIRKSFS